nr:MAG TPA: hypothetical protein [Caudoviricetes sp.]
MSNRKKLRGRPRRCNTHHPGQVNEGHILRPVQIGNLR